MDPKKRAAAQEKHRNLMYAYTSNLLFPPSILTLRIHLIDHDHPSFGPRRRSRSIATPLEAKCTSSIHLTHHPCHPPSSFITHPHHVEYSPHPTPLPGRICAPLRPKRRSRKIATPRKSKCTPLSYRWVIPARGFMKCF